MDRNLANKPFSEYDTGDQPSADNMVDGRDHQRDLRTLLHQMPIGMALVSRTGRIIQTNRKFCDILGYTAEELKGRTFQGITFSQDVSSDMEGMHRLLAGEIENHVAEKRCVRKDGSLLWAQMTCAAVAGENRGVLVMLEDISGRKQAELILKESEKEFRDLAENAHAAFGIIQGERFMYANPYFVKWSGYSREEILSMDFPQMVHPAFRGIMEERARKRQRGEPVQSHYEFMMIKKSGECRWVDFSPAVTVYRGKPAVIGTGFDITERKRVEDALRQSELRLAEAKDAAEAANRAKDRFLAVLSHELRTPLAPVLTAVSMLETDSRLPPELMDDMVMVRRNVELEARLIDDLLDVTRISQGKIELKIQPVQVCAMVKNAAAICAADIEQKRLQLDMELTMRNRWLRADPSRLQQIFWNLLKNAIKFTPAGGAITVRCYNDEQGWVVVEVADTGIGIEPDLLPRVFNAFEQGERTVTREFGGLGLGLTISRMLVELHGGSITAESAGRGRGALFRVRLPPGVAPETEPADETAKASPAAARREANVLLVEDHPDMAQLMGRLLRGKGYSVKIADSVHAALQFAEAERFDLLLSDLGLPDGSGLDLLRQLRGSCASLRAIAFSGYGMEEDVRRSREAGFAEHLTKPMQFHALLEAIDRVMSGDRQS